MPLFSAYDKVQTHQIYKQSSQKNGLCYSGNYHTKKASASALAYGVGKLPTSRRYNQLPLLRSSPGGFARSWPYRTYPYIHYLSSAKVRKNYDVTNIKGHFLSSHGHKRTFWRENRTQTAYFTHFFTKFATQRQQPFGLSPLP